jgi:hypothetical protein
MLRQAFLINGIIELIGGILFFSRPDIIFDLIDHQANDYNIIRIMYSFAAVTIGFLSNMFYVYFKNCPLQILFLAGVIFMFFHFGLSTVLLLAYKAEVISHVGACWFHGALGALFVVSLFMFYQKLFKHRV